MKKTLPFEKPMIDTYQCSSYVQGIILAYPHLVNSLVNTYVNLACIDTEDIHEMLLQFADVLWDDFTKLGYFSKSEIYLKEAIKKGSLIDSIKEQIDVGRYPVLHHIDDYYLSYASKYLKTHYMHDTYIIGYDGDEFVVAAYTQKKYEVFKVKMEEIEEGLKSAAQMYDESTMIFIEVKDSKADIDIARITREYKDYINGNGSNSQNWTYGIRIYDVMIKCLQTLIEHNGEAGLYMDLRVTKVLWEHKRMMHRNISILNEICPIFEREMESLSELENKTHTIWNLSIMCKLKRDVKTLERIIILTEELREKEIRTVQSIIDRLNTWNSTDIVLREK